MIQTLVRCDGITCQNSTDLDNDMVPESWVRFDGKHYCGAYCFEYSRLRV